MKTSRQIAIVVGALALIEFSYIVTTHDATPEVAGPTVAELVAGGSTEASFLRTMIDRQRATVAIVERELRHGQSAKARKIAETMLANRRQELSALLELEKTH
jgi:uncharacterized protein (DUF305 family)